MKKCGVVYDCPYCQTRFPQKCRLRKHLKLNPTCRKLNEADPLELKNEIKIENNLEINENDYKNFKCEICAKAFKDQGGLVSHIKRIHDGIKMYACKSCERNFYTKTGLEKHEVKFH